MILLIFVIKIGLIISVKIIQVGNDESQFNFMQMKFVPPSHLYREIICLINEISLNSLKQNINHENNINRKLYRI